MLVVGCQLHLDGKNLLVFLISLFFDLFERHQYAVDILLQAMTLGLQLLVLVCNSRSLLLIGLLATEQISQRGLFFPLLFLQSCQGLLVRLRLNPQVKEF